VTDLWRLVRANNLILAAAGVLAGGWIALGAIALPKLLLFATLSGVGLGAAGNAANDVQDVAADRVNAPAIHPLAAGRLRSETAHLAIWFGIVLGLGTAALVSGRLVLVALLALAVMLGYSPLLKRHGVPGNVAVAAVGGLPLFYGALAVGRPGAGVVPWVLAAWLHLARELVKDLGDEAGDRAAGRHTLPVEVGLARTTRLAVWACAVFFPLAVVLPLATGYGGVYLDVASLSLFSVAIAVLAIRRQRFVTASGLLKVAMVFGLGALVLGRVV
jgi:geranylgeranylglycerol-phosphate geranylgeranyltransferase